MRTLVALLVLSITASITAAEPILIVSKSGFYLLTEDANGVPVPVKIKYVVATDGMPPVDVPPNTPDTPDNPPPTESDLTKQVKELAKATNDPIGAAAMSVVIKEVVKQSQGGKIADGDIYTAIGRANDTVLKSLGVFEKWTGFRTQLSAILTNLAQTGQIPNQKAKERILLEVAVGLDRAYPDNAINGELLAKIIQIISIILQAFFPGNTTI